MTSEIVRIFPKVSELNKILNKIECPENDCNEVFQNTPNLTLHLLKTHGKERSLKSSVYGCKVAQYYCPESGCKYCFNPDFIDEANSKFSNRFFSQFKYLKQHYIKVHLDKTFKCDKCNKGFPTESHRLRHTEVCGWKYRCSCGVVYSSLESLQTHARREQHTYTKEHAKGHSNRSRKPVISETTQSINTLNVEPVTIKGCPNEDINSCNLVNLPSDVNILILHGVVAIDNNVTVDNDVPGSASVSTQTDIISKRRKTLSPVKNCSTEKLVKRRTSKQTQTGEKRPKTTTETQTVYPNLVPEETRKGVKSTSSSNGRKRKKSMETQTITGNSASASTSSTVLSCASNSNNNNGNCDSFYNNAHHSDCVPTTTPTSDDYNSSGNITKKDICLPELWLDDENDVCKTNKDEENYSTDLNSTEVPGKDNMTAALSLDNIITQFDLNSTLSFCAREVNKESNSSCHIETQTEYDSDINTIIDDYLSNFDADILDQYTQTCDDVKLPDDIVLDLTNNETQTAWSLCDDSFISDVVNSETQTNTLAHTSDHET